jgi:hypothetical protein
MSGHVFHPGHAELHGITVVLEMAGEGLYVGRYHEETPAGILLHDVAEHRPAGAAGSREEFLRKTLKFGVHATHKHLVIPTAQVQRISRLVEWESGPS